MLIHSNTDLWVEHTSVLLFLSAHKMWPTKLVTPTWVFSHFYLINQNQSKSGDPDSDPKNTMPLEVSNLQASISKSTACRRHSQCHGSQNSVFWSGNPEFHTVLRPVNCRAISWPGNCHTVLEPANSHNVPEPANCNNVSEPGNCHTVSEPGNCPTGRQ